MRRVALAVLLSGIASAALAADPPVVNPGNPGATKSTATAATAATPADSPKTDPAPPWPPQGPALLSPSAPLDPKSRHAIALVHRFQTRRVLPSMGPRGEVTFIYGATQDTIVCAPLQTCDLALQAGEIVQNMNVAGGKNGQWHLDPGISGPTNAQVTHVIITVDDAGLRTGLAIQTNRRSYAIELVSTQHQYMPKIRYEYPSDQAMEWAQYQQMVGAQRQPMPPGGIIHYEISGDNPPWRPVEVYSDGQKTYIRFPPAMAYGKAPVLERLN
jgi:type IV secretion system protein TrbG